MQTAWFRGAGPEKSMGSKHEAAESLVGAYPILEPLNSTGTLKASVAMVLNYCPYAIMVGAAEQKGLRDQARAQKLLHQLIQRRLQRSNTSDSYSKLRRIPTPIILSTMRVYERMCVCVYVCMRACVYICVHVCMLRVCVYV